MKTRLDKPINGTMGQVSVLTETTPDDKQTGINLLVQNVVNTMDITGDWFGERLRTNCPISECLRGNPESWRHRSVELATLKVASILSKLDSSSIRGPILYRLEHRFREELPISNEPGIRSVPSFNSCSFLSFLSFAKVITSWLLRVTRNFHVARGTKEMTSCFYVAPRKR